MVGKRIEKWMLVAMLGALGCAQEHQVFVDNNGDGDAGRDDASQTPDAKPMGDAGAPDAQSTKDATVGKDADVPNKDRFGRPENCGLSESDLHRVATNWGACFDNWGFDAADVYDTYSALGLAAWYEPNWVITNGAARGMIGDCEFWNTLKAQGCGAVWDGLYKLIQGRESCVEPGRRCAGDIVETCQNNYFVAKSYDTSVWTPAGNCGAYGLTCDQGECVKPGEKATGESFYDYSQKCSEDGSAILAPTSNGEVEVACPTGTTCSVIPFQGEFPHPVCHVPGPNPGELEYGECMTWPGYGTGTGAQPWGVSSCNELPESEIQVRACVFGSRSVTQCSDHGMLSCGARRGCYCDGVDETLCAEPE